MIGWMGGYGAILMINVTVRLVLPTLLLCVCHIIHYCSSSMPMKWNNFESVFDNPLYW